MPYWKEHHVGDFVPTRDVFRTHLYDGTVVETARHNGGRLTNALTQTTYRSKSSRANASAVLVPENKADPYGLFRARNATKLLSANAQGFDTSWADDRGHPWDFIKLESRGSSVNAKLRNKSPAYYTWEVSGAVPVPQGPPWSGGVQVGFQTPVAFNLEAAGRDLYGKAAPTSQVFDLAQFLGELREGLPRLAADIFTKANFFKGLGSDYLNVQFGWKPFLADLQNAFKALSGASTVLFGPLGPVHRSRHLPGTYESSATKYSAVQLSTGTVGYQKFDYHPWLRIADFVSSTTVGLLTATCSASSRTESNTWFEGEFMLLPKIGFNPDSYLDRLGALVNTDITPSVLWELAPWSWLVDWFLHIGDAINAAETASDNRILSSYAYVMREDIHTNGVLATNIRSNSNQRVYEGPSSAAHEWTTTRKRRLRANPYGFGVNPSTSLNVGQWAILAALGFTKAGR